MTQSIKTKHALILVIILSLMSSAIIPSACATEPTTKEKALTFVADIAQIDLTAYDIELDEDRIDYPSTLKGLPQENIHYTLTTQDSKVAISLKIVDENLTYCYIYAETGALIYMQPQPDNVFERAKEFLQRYTIDEQSDLANTVKLVNASELQGNMVKMIGNVKLETVTMSDHTTVNLKYSFNGTDYTGLGVTFGEVFIIFRDDTSIYPIGNTAVNISEEQAIDLALDRVKDFSWTIITNGSAMEVTEFSIVDDPRIVELRARSKDNLTWSPYWNVELYLDRIYSGGIYAIQVGIWADTGEVFLCKQIGVGGASTSEDSETSEVPEMGITAIAGLLAASAIITTLSARHKKKNR